MYIERKLYPIINSKLFKGKAIIILGARQVGKSTLMKSVSDSLDLPTLKLNCDDSEIRNLLKEINSFNLKLLIGSNKLILIDEAQRVENIGLVIKRIVDEYADVQVMASGSSSLQLGDALNEPLTGRKYEYSLFPISTGELYDTMGLITTRQMLEARMLYGSYPEIITHQEEAKELLGYLSDSYLYKDILELEQIRKPVILQKILLALALQIGSEVSYNEIANTVGSDPKTVEKYIDLLTKSYVLYPLYGFSRNLRNELKKTKKIFFYDTGIRNAIIHNFAPIQYRTDTGSLWENFFIMERIKHNYYKGIKANYYFWRTKTQQEIDFIEEYDGKIKIFEMKWNIVKSNSKFPATFIEAYHPVEMHVVTPDNYLEFLLA